MKTVTAQHYSSESVWREPAVFFNDFRHDLRNCHELAWQLFLRNLKTRYRQSIAGYVWAFVPPLAWALLFVILRGQAFSAPSDRATYVPHVLVGLVFWQLFIEAAQTPMRTFSEARSMLAKLKFPRESLIAAGLLDVLFQFAVRLPMLVAGWALFPGSNMHGWWLVPALVAGLIVTGTCIGILLLPLSMLYQDVAQAVTLASGFLLMVTPVGYPPPTTGLAAAVNAWNPAAVLIETARAGWLGGPLPQVNSFALIALGALALGGVAWMGARVAFPHLIARIGS